MGRRILLVTRRFWPLATPADAQLLEIVDGWRGKGAEISVVTPQWDRSWPTQIVVREMPVARIAYAPKRLWGTYWYLRRLNQFLRRVAIGFDFLVVSRLQLDSLVAIRVGHDLGIPVILLYEGSGATGDAAWLRQSAHKLKICDACQRAAAIFTFSEASHEEALALGFRREICHLLRNPAPIGAPSDRRRSSARMHLLESNRDFFTTPSTPVGLTISPLEERLPQQQLFAAWSELRKHHLEARLWWIGDGPNRSSLYSMLGDYDLRYHAVLPGDFDDVEDHLDAADFYVAPSLRAAMSVRRALAAGRSVIAADSPEIRAIIPEGAPIRYYRAGDVGDLARSLRHACDAPIENARRGRTAHDWAISLGSPSDAAQEQMQILNALRPETR